MELNYTDNSSEDGYSSDISIQIFSDVSSDSSFERIGVLKHSFNTMYVPKYTSSEGLQNHINLLHKLRIRERTGNFSGNIRCAREQRAYSTVPKRLSFCLKDLIPYDYLRNHIFMGLTACGQYMMSYKVGVNDNDGSRFYTFHIGYKYTLYFWIYKPYKPLRKHFKTCLFDDHGVDNVKEVSVTQWKTSHRDIVIVHGAAENESEDSYISYVKVPKLNCSDCRRMRAAFGEEECCHNNICLNCKLTIHTKYSFTESDPVFNPHINLVCPNRILIIANGFVHMLHIELESSSSTPLSPHSTTQQQLVSPNSQQHTPGAAQPHESPSTPPPEAPDRRLAEETSGCDNQTNIIAPIVADICDIEADFAHSVHSANTETQRSVNHNEATGSATYSTLNSVTGKTFNEIIFNCKSNANLAAADGSSVTCSPCSGSGTPENSPSKASLADSRAGRRHRIVTKSYRNGVNRVDLQVSPSSTASGGSSSQLNTDKANAYEFSEDNEKCEKIATFRKRRLADKKYEFSEDNSENIVPFTKIRASPKQALASNGSPSSPGGLTTARALQRTATSSQYNYFNSPGASPSSSPRPSHCSLATGNGGDIYVLNHPAASIQCASTIGLGLRSPPTSGSPVGSAAMRSPGKHIGTAQICQQKSPSIPQSSQQIPSFKPIINLAALQVCLRNNELGGTMSPNGNVPLHSPISEENKINEEPLQGGEALKKPICTKKFKRRYVEEDEAASVITSEEDDCISPGYHTSLPMEVHGACYEEMQMISQASYQKLRPRKCVVITQHSFDLETFSYYVTSMLCKKNNKIYDVFNDWAYELITVCPHSNSIVCLLIVQFVVRDPEPCTQKKCSMCYPKSNLGRTQHRKPCECRILFTWNMDSGHWQVLDYGKLEETANFEVGAATTQKSAAAGLKLALTARNLSSELKASLHNMADYSQNMRVLKSNLNKSQSLITDLDNNFEFYLKHPSCMSRYN